MSVTVSTQCRVPALRRSTNPAVLFGNTLRLERGYSTVLDAITLFIEYGLVPLVPKSIQADIVFPLLRFEDHNTPKGRDKRLSAPDEGKKRM